MPADLEFTGERYMPSIGGNILLEHMHRYHLAKRYVSGKTVLDIASGEGFGSSVLAQSAERVIGVDISPQTVAHAAATYPRVNLTFEVGSASAIPLRDQSVDVVVSFETIEHVAEHEQMMSEIRRVLKPGGTLIISTPEKANYSDATGYKNPFHVRELYRAEFTDLLQSNFKHVTMHGQRIGFGSFIASETEAAASFEVDSLTGEAHVGVNTPLYLLAVASDDPSNVSGTTSLFSQDIMASEPVQVRVKYEQSVWEQEGGISTSMIAELSKLRIENGRLLDTILAWSEEVHSLQRDNWPTQARLGKLVRRLTMSRMLYGLSEWSWLKESRRKRFRRSAVKRDPLLIAARADKFCQDFIAEVISNDVVRANMTERLSALGMTVTAVVPNYNHARFLRQRLDSILTQTYPLVDIVILDDASTDESRDIIDEYVARYPDRVRAIFNESNSGSVFAQWRKGHEAATGSLVWFCESDDYCDPAFLERLLPSFRDPSVMLAFGRIQFVDDNGQTRPGLDEYRESAERGIWDRPVVRPAHEWFAGAFGVKNLIANVGGSLWRRFPIREELWETARTYSVMGDWYLYSCVAGGGQIAYQPKAVSYFRIHDTNSSVDAQKRASYYEEYSRLMTALKDRWQIPDATVKRFVENCRRVFDAASPANLEFDRLINLSELQAAPTRQVHVLIGFLGFAYGGGEIIAINLANALHRHGHMVSVLPLTDAMEHPDVRRMLSPGIPVYSAKFLRENHGRAFLNRSGVSVVHSHIVSTEMVIFDEFGASLPYISTLHGSYESMDIPKKKIANWAEKVSVYCYTAERNLEPFRDLSIPASKFRKFRNAMPVDEAPYPMTRAEMGIGEDAVVFAFVARGIEGKGWSEAVHAFQMLENRHPGRGLALIMVGEGEEAGKARAAAGGDPHIHFVGFQKQMHGLYRMSDVALAPTRFSGESFPLCLIQAMQSGTPIVSTDVGEIRAMLETDEGAAGIVVAATEDNDVFIADIATAMERMLDPGVREGFAKCAAAQGETYSIDALSEDYAALYAEVVHGPRR